MARGERVLCRFLLLYNPDAQSQYRRSGRDDGRMTDAPEPGRTIQWRVERSAPERIPREHVAISHWLGMPGAQRRAGDSWAGCFPAEPAAASPGSGIAADRRISRQVWDIGVMPQKIDTPRPSRQPLTEQFESVPIACSLKPHPQTVDWYTDLAD